MSVLYDILLTLFSPIWVPWMIWRARRRKSQPDWVQRQGDYPMVRMEHGDRIWVHAVSVGEVLAVVPILREYRALRPEDEIVLSVTTSSGHKTASDLPAGLYNHLVYFPIDVKRFQLAAMQRVRPTLVAVMETELWMNFLWAAKVFDANTMLINGRISDRSFARSKHLRFFYRSLLANMDRCLMQTAIDRTRILQLGARNAEVFGNSKFDQALEGSALGADHWRAELKIPPDKRVVVVGSTRGEAEENFVLDAIERVGLNDLVVVHAPRHLERVEALAEAVRKRFGAVALRSKGETGRYIVLDTYGELGSVYVVADVAVVGGGFDDLGGQNIVQPLAHGKPVLHGPHMNNFRQVAEAAAVAGASRVCSNPAELASSIVAFLEDDVARAHASAAAHTLVEDNLGASKRYANAMAEAVATALPTR